MNIRIIEAGPLRLQQNVLQMRVEIISTKMAFFFLSRIYIPWRKECNAKERCKNTLPTAKVSFRTTTTARSCEEWQKIEEYVRRGETVVVYRWNRWLGVHLLSLSREMTWCCFHVVGFITELCQIDFFCVFEFGRQCSTICVTQLALCWPFIPKTFKYHRNGDNWGRHVIGCRRRVIGSQFGQLFNRVMDEMVTEFKHERKFY